MSTWFLAREMLSVAESNAVYQIVRILRCNLFCINIFCVFHIEDINKQQLIILIEIITKLLAPIYDK